MVTINQPVDVISYCGADGEIRPLQVRFEDDTHQFSRIDIQKIHSTKHITYVGIEAQIFLCTGMLFQRSIQFELKYTIRTHNWYLFRKIY